MRGSKVFAYVFTALFLAGFANAAAIHGTVYDLSLKKVNNAIVEINTSPRQFMIAQNGTYSFSAPNGQYTIKSQLTHKNTVIASVQENITIKQDGSYVLDLILFPDIGEGMENISIDVSGNLVETGKQWNNNIFYFASSLVILAMLALAAYFYKATKQKKAAKTAQETEEEPQNDDYLEQIIKFVRQEGGRATQKGIRKQIPMSEAKVSLMIAELEHKGIIEKIKKGRGNIIILKKK